MDACSLIHLERSSQLKHLPAQGVRLFIPDRVAREVNAPPDARRKRRLPLETWLRRNPRLVTEMLTAEGELYLRFRSQPDTKLHDGEAAALAIAVCRNAMLVTDDAAAQRKATLHDVPHMDSATFVRDALPRQLGLL
jgi:predicted nucleic acid-binding protein